MRAQARAEQIAHKDGCQRQETDGYPVEDEIIVAERIERHAEEIIRRRRQGQRFADAEQFPVREQPDNDLLRCQGCNRQIETFETRRRQPEERADQRGEQAGDRNGDPHRRVQTNGEQPRSVRADCQESAMADTDLTGISHQDVETDCANRSDGDGIRQVQPVTVGEPGEDQHGDQHDGDPHPLRPVGSQRHIASIRRMEGSALHSDAPFLHALDDPLPE
jgi:hypothetical protein